VFRLLQVALAEIIHAQLQVVFGSLLALLIVHLVLAAAAASGRDHREHGAQPLRRFHDCTATDTSLEPRRTVVLFCTRPTSCPQAASISSPRVRRVVAITPCLFK